MPYNESESGFGDGDILNDSNEMFWLKDKKKREQRKQSAKMRQSFGAQRPPLQKQQLNQSSN